MNWLDFGARINLREGGLCPSPLLLPPASPPLNAALGVCGLTLPIRVGVILRLVPMAVKLNGVTAATNPSMPRYSILFQVLGEWCLGWSYNSQTILQSVSLHQK